MNLKARFSILGLALISAFVLASCGGSGGSGVNLSTDGDALAFNPATITIKANTPTTITFKNGSTGLQHNLVVVKGGDDVASAIDDASVSAAPSYVPANDPDIAGSTNLLNGGDTGTASVNLPAGTYTYLCTYPGHYQSGMKGTITVQ